MKTGVIIAAAGMSSRMGQLKPLLTLGDKTVIEHMADNAGIDEIDEIVVVVGREKEKLAEKLRGRKLRIAVNEEFDTSDMMTSIQCGARVLSADIDCFFVIPADMPLVKGECYFCMLERYGRQENRGIVQICFQGKGGHPLLIGSRYRDAILQYRGGMGLKDALKPYASAVTVYEWHNPAVLMDMDTKEDYRCARQLYEETKVPDRETVVEIMRAKKMPPELTVHSAAVERAALRIAECAGKRGYPMDLKLVSAAALLHDIARGTARHAEKGAEFAKKLGYANIADIIREHMFISGEGMEHIDERAAVFLADKLVKGDRIVSVEERFAQKMAAFEGNPEVYRKIRANKENALKLWNLLTGLPRAGEGEELWKE